LFDGLLADLGSPGLRNSVALADFLGSTLGLVEQQVDQVLCAGVQSRSRLLHQGTRLRLLELLVLHRVGRGQLVCDARRVDVAHPWVVEGVVDEGHAVVLRPPLG
jgi:hypothetical protein